MFSKHDFENAVASNLPYPLKYGSKIRYKIK
jgi:hypothetical protein